VLAQDLITRAPVVLPLGSSLSEAARRMRDAAVGSIVVMDGGRPAGILTDRDVTLFLAGQIEDALVEEVMTSNPASIPAMGDVGMCLDRMEEEGVRRILIVEDATLVGVISLDDIVMHLAYLLGKASSLIRREVSRVSGSTL
jgi:CBS domain-containing protein